MISAYQKLHITGVQAKMKACKWEGSLAIVLYKMFPLQGYGKGTALCLLLLLRHIIYGCASCAISLLPHILSVIQSLPNLHSSSSHFRKLMRKVQSSCESEDTLWGSDAQNATAELEAAPRRERKGGRRKQRPVWTCASQGKLFLSTSWRGGSGREDEGHRVVKLAWKYSCSHYFPNRTVFKYILLVTLGWHICVYFVL